MCWENIKAGSLVELEPDYCELCKSLGGQVSKSLVLGRSAEIEAGAGNEGWGKSDPSLEKLTH